MSGARKLCNEICKVDSSDASIWCLLACIHGRTDKYKEAVRCAKKSVEINPSYDSAWVILGHALLELKRPNDASTAYERALGINSGYIYTNDTPAVSQRPYSVCTPRSARRLFQLLYKYFQRQRCNDEFYRHNGYSGKRLANDRLAHPILI